MLLSPESPVGEVGVDSAGHTSACRPPLRSFRVLPASWGSVRICSCNAFQGYAAGQAALRIMDPDHSAGSLNI